MPHNYIEGDEAAPGYRLLQFLGEGGFGKVWKAAGPGGTRVALKIIRLGGMQGRKEFRSLQLVKLIRHPNLVPVYAFWLKDADGRILDDAAADQIHRATQDVSNMRATVEAPSTHQTPPPAELIIAMGLGDKNLFDRLEECRAQGLEGLPPDELLEYMEGAAKAIDFLNRPIHDLGSGLVAIQHCDIKPHNIMIVGGAVQICDFGLSRVMGGVRATTTTAGTVAYAAPECLKEGKPSHSTDQYSLAVSFFELRTGALPYASETFAAVTSAALEGKLELARLAPAEREVIRKATSVDPSKRYASAEEMAEAISAAVKGGPVPAAGSGKPHWAIVAGLAVAACLVVAAVGVWGLRSGTSSPREPSPRTASTGVTGVRNEPLTGLTRSQEDAEARFQRVKDYLKQEQFDQAIKEFEALRDQPGYASRPEIAVAYLERGTAALRRAIEFQDDATRHKEELARAIPDLEEGARRNPRDDLLFSRLGTAYLHNDQWREAADAYGRALAIKEDEMDYVNQGRAYQKLKERDNAIRSFQKAAERNPRNAEAHYLLASLYEPSGDYRPTDKDLEEAIRALTAAIDNYTQTPVFDLAHAYFWRASCARLLKRLDDAARDFDLALKQPEARNFEPRDAIPKALAELVAAFAEENKYRDAATWMAKAVDLVSDPLLKVDYQAALKEYQAKQ